jgi:hypothetical protein
MFHVNSVPCLSALFALSILTAVVRQKMGDALGLRSLQFLFVTRQNTHLRQLQPFRCSEEQTNFSKETNMRKVAGVLSLLMALAISLLAGPLYANESQAVKRTVAPSKYDVTKEVTLEGTIQSLVRKPAPGTIMGAHLMVSTGHGTVDAHIGNYFVVGKYAMPFASGESVKLVGIMATINHQSVFLVRTLQTGNSTITVRSDHGFLIYPGAKTHLASISSTGGAR